MKFHFFAFLSRLKLIRRWGLMRNTQEENDLEHTCQVAFVAHALAEIKNARHGGALDISKVLSYALYHEVAEVITGDLPSPIKYSSAQLTASYKRLERDASVQMLSHLPEDLRPVYESLLLPDETSAEWGVVKAADKICAFIKCAQERHAGNPEFEMAYTKLKKQVDDIDAPEVRDFLSQFTESFMLPIDALNC